MCLCMMVYVCGTNVRVEDFRELGEDDAELRDNSSETRTDLAYLYLKGEERLLPNAGEI